MTDSKSDGQRTKAILHHLPKELQPFFADNSEIKLGGEDDEVLTLAASDEKNSGAQLTMGPKKGGSGFGSIFEHGLLTTFAVFHGGHDYVSGASCGEEWTEKVQKDVTESTVDTILLALENRSFSESSKQ